MHCDNECEYKLTDNKCVKEVHHKCTRHLNCYHHHYYYHYLNTESLKTDQINHMHHFKVTSLQDNNPMATTVPTGYIPTQIRKAYGLTNIAADGTGQVIGIIGAFLSPTIINDFKKFDTQFGINKPNNLTVKSFGTTTNQGWHLEACLDVQWAHALAPGAKILLVQAKSNSISDLLTAINYANANGATIISMSWGSNEFSNEAQFESGFNKQNCVYIASSGDTGGVVSWPSASPKVLSVGGTTLTLNSLGVRSNVNSEIGWSDGGGGQSLFEPLPHYQAVKGLTGKRHTPDISIIANPGVSVYDTFGYLGQKGWFSVGGTSLGAVCWAPIIAIANQLRISKNKTTLSTNVLQTYLYNTMSKGQSYAKDFYDVTVGNAGTNNAKIGYDNIGGLGAPKNDNGMSGMIADLVNVIP